MLLPLLNLLIHLPFDKKLVTQSKINKQIRKISKQIDSLTELPEKPVTHPMAGGLPVARVQKALDTLKNSWERQAVRDTSNDKVHLSLIHI